jgi:hypothetical protein
MPFPNDKSDAPKAATPVPPKAASAAPVRATPMTDDDKAAAKAFDEQLKDAKAAVNAADDGDLKDEAQRGVDQAEALYASGHADRAEAALKQAQAVLPRVTK